MRDAFLKLRVGEKTGREAFRFDPYSVPIVRDAYEVGVYIVYDASDPKGFIIITAYPRNEESMAIKSVKPPQAFFIFAERMFQDADFFDTVEDFLRFGLQAIPRGQLGDFITFVKRIENREFGDRELETLWFHSGADMGYPAAGLRIFLGRARTLAEKEGPDGSLYRKTPKWNSEPTPKDLI